MHLDPEKLLYMLDYTYPLVGFYDAPDSEKFKPLITLADISHTCIFNFFNKWIKGETLHLTQEEGICKGSEYWLCGKENRPRESFVKFLVDGEGLRSSHELMNQWLDETHPYKQKHKNLLIGPLKADQYPYLKTVSFFVNPDQLSALIAGSYYNRGSGDEPAVTAPFGAGCMELLPLFKDYTIPQAIIGSTDMAMRKHLPPDIMAFTVTVPLFEELCTLDQGSFLYKPFWKNLRNSRGLPDLD